MIKLKGLPCHPAIFPPTPLRTIVFDSAVPIDRFGAREVSRALSSSDVGAALPYNLLNPIGMNGAYFCAKLGYTF